MPEFETMREDTGVSVLLVTSMLLMLILSEPRSSSGNHESDCLFSYDKLLKRREEPEYASWPKEPDKR